MKAPQPKEITQILFRKKIKENLLPGIITDEKNIVLPVDKYKLPAWSQRVF